MLRALIFDSFYDRHRGVIAYIRIFEGQVKPNSTVHFLATKSKTIVTEVGVFRPDMQAVLELTAGEVGYLVTGLKEIDKVAVGDTVCSVDNQSMSLSGYKQVEPKVFASIFTVSQDEYPKLRDAISKLKLNDASLVYETENIPALGFGFRCGFLGLLHLDIVKERLQREFDLELIVTTPSVEYKVLTTSIAANIDTNQKRPFGIAVSRSENYNQVQASDFETLKNRVIEGLAITDLKRLQKD